MIGVWSPSVSSPEDNSARVLLPATMPLVLFTDVSLHLPPTLLAHHIATPVIFTVTPLHHLLHVGVVATATAHKVATVAAHGGLVALPAKGGCTSGSWGSIPMERCCPQPSAQASSQSSPAHTRRQ